MEDEEQIYYCQWWDCNLDDISDWQIDECWDRRNKLNCWNNPFAVEGGCDYLVWKHTGKKIIRY